MKNKLKESPTESLKVIAGIIDDIEIGMITTRTATNQALVSRPMQVQEVDQEGCLWFFTSREGELIREVNANPQVNITFAAANKNTFLSMTGQGSEVQDRSKMQELWKPQLKAWFKDGLDTPDITLLKIKMQEGQFWDAPHSTAVEIVGFVKALISDAPFRPGRNEKVDLRH